MKTKILKINPKKPEISKIKEASKQIQQGNLVAFPTETVYGLGADALNENAVKKIFLAKGRPQDNPLIVHISNLKDLKKLTTEIPKEAKLLIKNFWPGPLTIILRKSKLVPKVITANLETVAIRMPENKIALELIKFAETPIAAPSANLSGKPSPTACEHVINDMTNKIPIIIDGGKCKIGLESTVIDLTTKPATLLRPGGITLEQLKKVIKKIQVHKIIHGKKQEISKVKSPGMKYKHYAPNAPIILVKPKQKNEIIKIINQNKNKKIAVITTIKDLKCNAKIFFLGTTHKSIGSNLFHALRDCDKYDVDLIICEKFNEKGLGLAIMNRLRKAASKG